LLKEKKAFAKEKPSDEILDFYDLGDRAEDRAVRDDGL
jgi:hypothetical protein